MKGGKWKREKVKGEGKRETGKRDGTSRKGGGGWSRVKDKAEGERGERKVDLSPLKKE